MKKTLLITGFMLYVICLHAQVLYNLTSEGGSSSIMGKFGYGTIGKFLPARNQLTAVKSFVPEGNLGHTPYASLVLASDGKMYGVTIWGGDNNKGVIFSFDPHSSTYTKVKEFHGNDGERPYGALIQAYDKKLYGMTYYGGINRVGVLYSFDPSTSIYTKLHDFGLNNEGHSPRSSLVQASDGKLYGMTQLGGSSDAGTIFSFDPSSFTFKNLKDFDYANDGGYPGGSLVQAKDGKLYGGAIGGKTSNGVIFSLDPATSTFQKLKDLDSTNGAGPNTLIQASDGKLYGTTGATGVDINGSNYGYGVIFSFDPSTFQYTNLHDFDFDKDGAYPLGSLLQASDGKLYGGTRRGGKNDNGTILSFDPLNSTFTKLVDYDGLNGGAWASEGKFIEVDECFDADSTWYKDADDDGYGDRAFQQKGCPRPAGYVADGSDCDDNNAAIHTPVTFYRDFDSDGFGNARDPISTCSYTPPAGYVADSTDCNDNNKDILGPFTYYKDYDLDGFGDPYHPIHTCSDVPPATYIRNNYDCYDGDGPTDPALVRIRMCHDGWTQCVYVKDTAEKLRLGWSIGLCPLQSCGADETLMCHNGRQECVKTTEVEAKLAEIGGKWSLGPYCSGVPISNKPELTRQKKIAKIATEKSRPIQYSLSNHPNPFAGTSTIKYELPLDSKVSIKVYDLMGRTVATLVDEYKKAGTYTVNFDARRLSSGSLFYKIIARSKRGNISRLIKW